MSVAKLAGLEEKEKKKKKIHPILLNADGMLAFLIMLQKICETTSALANNSWLSRPETCSVFIIDCMLVHNKDRIFNKVLWHSDVLRLTPVKHYF